ncbi:MAG: hypothetical protein IKP31_06795 [Lachnospiraceae bacterium]|nr:hypothetical protein [Lachnospiraceae bacterium]
MLDKILLLKSKDGIEQIQAYYNQPAGSVDALFVGSSHIFCHVNTGVLWDDYGISSFDLAAAEQPFWNSYYYIREALKTQNPKVIILDITTPGIRPTDYQPENWLITNTYGIKYNADRYNAIKVSALDISFRRLLIPFNSTHGKYDELSEDDFMNYSSSVNFKGFDARETTVPFEVHDVSGITERCDLTEKEEKYLRLTIEYVKQNNIPLLLISSPYVVETVEEQEKYNTIFDIADEYNVPYVDFNLLYDEIGLDFSTDIAEVLHLNRSGNEKFTRYLGQYLKDNYDLADHRGDSKYASWDADALYQRQDTGAYHLNQAASNKADGKYLDLLNNSNYVIYCTIPSGYAGIPDPSLQQYLNAIGLTEDKLTDNKAFIINSGQCVFESDASDFKAAIEDGNRRLLFCRSSEPDSEQRQTLVRTNGSMGYQCITDYETYEMSQEGISFYVYDIVLDRIIGGYTIR